jgi:hypothetical protein
MAGRTPVRAAPRPERRTRNAWARSTTTSGSCSGRIRSVTIGVSVDALETTHRSCWSSCTSIASTPARSSTPGGEVRYASVKSTCFLRSSVGVSCESAMSARRNRVKTIGPIRMTAKSTRNSPERAQQERASKAGRQACFASLPAPGFWEGHPPTGGFEARLARALANKLGLGRIATHRRARARRH